LFFGKNKKKIIIFLIILVLVIVGWNIFGPKKSTPSYQTATVQKGTLVQSLGESGTVAVANRVSVSTQASGVVTEVDVKNGDTVTSGQTIAKLSLDSQGQQKQAAAWAQYLSAKSSLAAANATLYSLQSTMYTNWNLFYQKAINSTYQNPDGSPNSSNRTLPDFTTTQDNWLSAQANYQNQQQVIAQDQASLNNAWLSYQQLSDTITAPTSGVLGDINIVPGMQITNTTSSSTNTVSSQTVASIINPGNPVITVNLSELDAVQVKAGLKATVTFDALPNKTFSGKVLGINTTGSVTSGVTTYPAIIQLDVPDDHILPNMSATANIIIAVKDNVLEVPTAAVQSTGGQSSVRVLENGKIITVPVETGISSDTDTEIVSGLTEGQTVVTGFTATTSSNGSSPFSSFGGRGFGGVGRGG
ncbi:MAG TPA: HlyD family efflux transporter periplasmic adaptor subunit, partial [Patescibacteria group bacterium]